MRASDIMTSPVVTVRTGTPVKEAAALLAARGFTALPVVDADARLVGIVTEADLMRDRIPRDPRDRIHTDTPRLPLTAPSTVGAVMSAPVIAMDAGTDLADLADLLLERRLRSVPIVRGATLVGILTRRDLVRVVGRADTDIAKDVHQRLQTYGGPHRYQVDVHDGVVIVTDQHDNPTDHHIAVVLAEAVPGVVRAEAHRGPAG
jgi:CBS domain-containing protein